MNPNVQKYERSPYVLRSTLESVLAASGTTQFTDSDLRNDSGYDFEVCRVAFDVTGNTPELADMRVRISDLSRNIAWSKDHVPISLLVKGGLSTVGNSSRATWELCKPVVLPANANLRCEIQNADTTQKHGASVAFIGHLLVPIQPGTRFDEAVQHAEQARP